MRGVSLFSTSGGRFAAGAAVAMCLVATAGSASADEFASHQRRGAEYLQSQRYAQALVELKAAYEMQQRPLLLYYIARCYHKMGQRREAIEYYDRYIVSEPDPGQRTDAQQYVEELSGDNSILNTNLAPVRPIEKGGPRWGMIAAGATLFTLSYGSALIVGAMGLAGLSSVSGVSRSDLSMAQAGLGTLLVPLAGPLISGVILRSPEWSLPWTLVNLPAQVVGVVLLAAGAQNRHPTAMSRLAVLPSFSSSSAALTVAGQF